MSQQAGRINVRIVISDAFEERVEHAWGGERRRCLGLLRGGTDAPSTWYLEVVGRYNSNPGSKAVDMSWAVDRAAGSIAGPGYMDTPASAPVSLWESAISEMGMGRNRLVMKSEMSVAGARVSKIGFGSRPRLCLWLRVWLGLWLRL
jgi:hypothetical protein